MTNKEMFGEALWVSPNGKCDTPYIRGEFRLSQEVEAARITICGLGFFELSLNGKRVSDEMFNPVNSEFHSYDERECTKCFGEILGSRIYCVQYDVKEYLTMENCIGVLLAPGWYKNEYTGWGTDKIGQMSFGEVKLCFKLEVAYKDGSRQQILSGDWLQWTQSPIVSYSFHKGEVQDYDSVRLEGWNTFGFTDGQWNALEVIEAPDTEYYVQDCPADKIIRYITPRLICEKKDCFIYDLGENISGTPILRSRVPGVQTLTVTCGETLDAGNSLKEENIHEQTSVFITDGTDRCYGLMMTWYGFRYAAVSKNAEMVSAAVIHTDVAVTSAFQSDVPILNWLYEAYIRTQLDNMHSGIPSDCPHLERLGYTGDGELVCECGMMMLDAKRFYRKWLGDIADCQDTVSGHVQYTAPYYRCGGGPGGWGCAIIEVPYTYYKMYGDTSVLEEFFPRTMKYFGYLDAHSKEDLVVSDQPGLWCLGDWCTPEKIAIPEPFVNTYFYIKSIGRAIEACRILGYTDQIAALEDRRQHKIQALTARYYDASTGNFAENMQGANAFALDLGLGDERTLQNVVARYENYGMYDTGIFGTDIVTRVLLEKGYGQLAFDLMTSQGKYSFYNWMVNGSTTLPEYWTFKRSQNHPMFGAVVKYLFSYYLGIRNLDTAYKTVEIAPCLVKGMNYAEGYITTENGKIEVKLVKQNKAVSLRIRIPENVNAVFRLNGTTRQLTGGINEFVMALEA